MIAAISFATLGFSAIQTLTFSISVQRSKVVLFGGKGKRLSKFMQKEVIKLSQGLAKWVPKRFGCTTSIFQKSIIKN